MAWNSREKFKAHLADISDSTFERLREHGIISDGVLVAPRVRAWLDAELARTDALIAAGAIDLLPRKGAKTGDDEATLSEKAARLGALIAEVDAALSLEVADA